MTAAMPPARPAGGPAAGHTVRPPPAFPAPSARSALEDLAGLAARLLGAPWAAVSLGEGPDAFDILPEGQVPLPDPALLGSAPAGAGARLVVCDRSARALSPAEACTLSDLGRQAGALLDLDRQVRERTVPMPPGTAEFAPHLKTFLDNLPAAAFIKDENHRFIFANRALWRVYNDTGEEGDPSELDETARLSPESVEAVRRADLEVLRTGSKQEQVLKLVYGGRDHIWWVCKFPVTGSDGRPKVGCVSLDITDLDRARYETRLFEAAFRNAQVGVLIWKLEEPEDVGSFRLLAINPAASRLMGIAEADIVGRPMREAFPEVIRLGIAEVYRRVLRTGRAEDLGEVRYSDDRIEPTYFTAKVFHLFDDVVGVSFDDVTELRAVRDKLRRIVERFELIARATSDALFELDLATGKEWWNDRVYDLLGQDPTAVPPNGSAWLERVHPEDRDRVRASIAGNLAGRGDHFTEEYRIVRDDGSLRHVFARGYVARDPAGTPTRVLGAIMDISGLKQAEEALRENEERYRRLVEIIPDVIAISIDGILEFVNPAGVAMRGADSAEEMLGRHILEFFHPDDRARVAERQRVLAQGEAVPPLLFRFLRTDGTAIEAESRAFPFPFRGKRANMVVIRDVTERRRAEEALRRSEEHYRLLFHGSPLPMYLVDLDSLRFVDANRAAQAQYGYSREEFLGITLKDIRPPEEIPHLQEKVRRIRSESGSMGVWAHRRKDGSPIQAEIVAHPLEDAGRSPTVLVIAQDVTERLQVLERLRLSEERYRTLARVSPVGLFRTDPGGDCVYVNEHCTQIFGIPSDRLEGRGWTTAIHPDDRGRIVAGWESASSSRLPYHAEYRVARPDGRFPWVDCRAQAERGPDGSHLGYVGTLMDITERKQAETLLAGQKRILGLIASGSGLGEALDELLRFVEAEGSGLAGGVLLADAGSDRLAWAAAPGLPGDLRLAMDRLPRGAEGGPAGLSAAGRLAVDCGDIRAEAGWTRGREEALANGYRACLARPILGSHGGMLGVLVVFSRSAGRPCPFEAKLLETALDLAGIAVDRRRQEEIARLNQELSEENRRILEANRMKSEFLASMSHELRTPLNAIIGFSQLLIDRKVGPLNDKQGEYMGDILDGGMHLLRLINDVLDLAKIESGKMQLHLEEMAVARAVREVCDILMPMALAKGIAFRVSADMRPETAVLDSQKFKQVLYNLVSNAIKFSHQGGTVSIGASRLPGGALRVEVADRGIGIRKEDLGRLFQEFQQLDSGSARHFPGTGLGLVITKKLVELHGGTVGVESRPGEGSAFSAVFPSLELPEE